MLFQKLHRIGANDVARKVARKLETSVTATTRLEVTKALRQIAFVDRAYNLGVWSSDRDREDWEHDLALMRAHGDLTHVRIELLAGDNTVLFEFQIALDGERAERSNARRGVVDSAKGVELPILDTSHIATHRVVISHNARRGAYGHLLKRRWTKAATIRKRPGTTYESEHSRVITGDRQCAAFHVSDESRRSLVVTRSGGRGYAFGKDLDTGMDGVFLLDKFAPKGTAFRQGQRYTAVLVQTPRGIQARAIQPA
ncbi:hypothetical protein HOK31_27100 [Candidatus Poribacteria bacterium]|jgi:hypothetical protein|nr:hypothetical protein [Candidatus Poribacteria bacterium]